VSINSLHQKMQEERAGLVGNTNNAELNKSPGTIIIVLLAAALVVVSILAITMAKYPSAPSDAMYCIPGCIFRNHTTNHTNHTI